MNVELSNAYREYKDLSRYAWADKVFGRNARRRLDELGTLLLKNGITYIPNIFGDIPIRSNWSK
jgi:hypothetical protein